MRKNLLVLAIVIFLVFAITKYIKPFYFGANEPVFKIFPCLLPDREGIEICCVKDNESIICTNKTTFYCGEEIELYVKLVDINSPSYVCMNMSLFNLPWVCSKEISYPSFYFQEPSLKVPPVNGNFSFIEVYLLTDNLSNKIMSLYRDVKC